jgi:GNAT superfamily N-acetyltransferase
MQVKVRPLADSDSITELTQLLHRAYAQLADMGLKFVATHQDDETTKHRLKDAECYVAERDGRIVGTILLRPPGKSRGCDWYNRPDVAVFGQFGVEPSEQGQGIGGVLLDHVELRARETNAAELALDTAESAHHLIALYTKRGFRIVGNVKWEPVNYRSVIMSKRL